MNNHLQITLTADDGTSVKLNSPEDSIYLKPDIDGLTTLPTIRSSTGTNVGMDGGWTSAQFFDARLISIQGVIANQDVAVVEEKRRELNALLAKKKLLLTLVTESGKSYTVETRVTGSTMVMSNPLIIQEFKIDLRADDPLIYDNSGSDIVATLQVVKATGGFEINFEIPFRITGSGGASKVENTGNSEVNTLITLKNQLHSPNIVNQTTNQQLAIAYDMKAGDVMVIDSKLQTVTLNGQDAYQYVSGSFITLAAGNNVMKLQTNISGDDGIAEISYKSGYYSI